MAEFFDHQGCRFLVEKLIDGDHAAHAHHHLDHFSRFHRHPLRQFGHCQAAWNRNFADDGRRRPFETVLRSSCRNDAPRSRLFATSAGLVAGNVQFFATAAIVVIAFTTFAFGRALFLVCARRSGRRGGCRTRLRRSTARRHGTRHSSWLGACGVAVVSMLFGFASACFVFGAAYFCGRFLIFMRALDGEPFLFDLARRFFLGTRPIALGRFFFDARGFLVLDDAAFDVSLFLADFDTDGLGCRRRFRIRSARPQPTAFGGHFQFADGLALQRDLGRFWRRLILAVHFAQISQ